MNTTGQRALRPLGLFILLACLASNVQAAVTDLATAPLVTGATIQVQPNIFLMMDDSGSMAWDYMPDINNSPPFGTSKYGYASMQCNGVYYDPSIVYSPPALATPITLTGGATTLNSAVITYAASSLPLVGQVISGNSIPVGAYIVSLTGTTQATLNVNATATVSSATFTINAYPVSAFNAAPVDGFGVTTTTNTNLGTSFVIGTYTGGGGGGGGGGPAYYYNYTGAQNTEALRNFYNSSSTFFTECNTNASSASSVFTKVYVGTTSTLTISGSTNTSVTGITVNGSQIMSAASTASTTPGTVATNIAARINACTAATSGSCTVAGYSAAADGSILTIIAPLSLATTIHTLTPSIAPTSGIMTITPTAFVYSGPGNTIETGNYANWYSFYRTRILMMKSASGMAFNKLDANYRVGFGTMNNNVLTGTGNKFLNLSTFNSTQKSSFLTMLYSTSPGNSTPLLQALSEVGLMYANKITTINGVSVTDPMQYSCQQNYTILSTDGFWNDATNSVINTTGTVVTSTTAVGNQDGTEPTNSKQYDGTQQQYTKTTGPLQWTTNIKGTGGTLQSQISTLQKTTYSLLSSSGTLQATTYPLMSSTSNLQTSTMYLQSRTKASSGASYSAWGSIGSCTWKTSGSYPWTQCQYAISVASTTVWSAGAASWSGSTSSCTFSYSSGTSGTWTGNGTSCQYAAYSTAALAPGNICTYQNQQNNTASGQTWNAATTCSYGTASGPTNAASCTYANKTTATTNSTVYQASPKVCSYSWTTAAPASACTYKNGTSATTDGTVYVTSPLLCSYSTSTSNASACSPVSQTTATTDGTVYQTAPASCSYSAYSGWTNVGANGSCTTVAQDTTAYSVANARNCRINASATAYVSAYPPACSISYTNPGTSTADASGNSYSACPTPGTFNTTWTNVVSPGTCTPSANVNCRYNWGSATTTTSCNASLSSGTGAWSIINGTQCALAGTINGTSNTLSDVAEYYYVHDLRNPSWNNCTGYANSTICSTAVPDPYDNVPPSRGDTASWQHMTTFTLGLGARGRMVFSPTYTSDPSGDYFDINHSTANPPTNCSWQAANSGNCTWPIPNVSGKPENIDDLWHAAVDGRGLYYSATNPAALANGLTNALASVQERTGAAAAATTSDPNISQGNNFLFASTFTTLEWSGELVREQIDLATGQVITTLDPITGKYLPVNDWKAQAMLDNHLWSTRNIYTYDSANTNGNHLKLFTWALLSGSEPALFSDPGIDTLSQLCTTAPALWQASHSYLLGNQFVASGTTYIVILPYTSGATFGATDLANTLTVTTPACLPVWSASTAYPVGAQYRVISGSNTTWYQVNTAYTSGATFGTTDTTNSTATASALLGVGGVTTATPNVTGAAGANLVNFLRGDRSNEEGATPDNTKYYRNRTHVLGDIVNSEGTYVSNNSYFSYADPGYAGFASTLTAPLTTRQSIVYVAANDGMLHAFYATSDNMDPVSGIVVTTGGVAVQGGDEAWSYIPKMVLPNIYKLADKNYKNQHQYSVDGTPITGDVCISGCSSASTAVWKTILVGGLNGGGRGYYALDVTNPANPIALWEFTDTNMGYSYGNPVITKLADGTWVVLLTSGYNNVTPGDGQGHLYVLNAYTGTLNTAVNGTGIISTGAGSTTSPSGLTRITAEVIDPASNNTTLQVYGGDLLGNLWRFDINNNVGAAGYDAQLLATLIGPNNVAQPITVKPDVGLIGTSTVVYIGTGRYLGQTDVLATDQVAPNTQTIYGIYDPLSTTTTPSVAIYTNPRTDTTFVSQTLTSGTCPGGSLCQAGQLVLFSTNNPVNIPTNHGWFVDLPLSGQRDNTDPALQRGTLDFTINLPTGAGASCTNGGSSYNLTLDYKSGGAVNTATVTVTVLGITSTYYISGVFLGNALATRPIFVELPSGAVVSLIRMGTGDTTVANVPIGSGSTNTRRVSWRELVQ